MVDTTVETRLLTEDELMALGSDARVEIIDGEVVEMSPVGEVHHHIAGNFYRILDTNVRVHRLGVVFMDGLLYILDAEAKGIRGARMSDVSFIRKESLPPNRNIEKPLRAAPTLAIEVISPSDSMEDVMKRIQDYFEAGTEQVWLAFPRTKEVHVYTRGMSHITLYRSDDSMDVSALFPGLSLSLSDVFALPNLD